VYLAEQLAKHLAGKGGVEVELRHQELERIEHLGQEGGETRREQQGPETQAV